MKSSAGVYRSAAFGRLQRAIAAREKSVQAVQTVVFLRLFSAGAFQNMILLPNFIFKIKVSEMNGVKSIAGFLIPGIC